MPTQRMIREAVGIFDDPGHMEHAIDALELAGFDRRHISVLGSEPALRERFGGMHIATHQLEDHPYAPRSADIKKEELGIGQGILIGGGLLTGVVAGLISTGGMALPAAATAIALTGAGGTAVGALLAKLLGEKYAEFFQHQIDQGGLLLWVSIPSPQMEAAAQDILRQYGARDIHVHELPAMTEKEREEEKLQIWSA